MAWDRCFCLVGLAVLLIVGCVCLCAPEPSKLETETAPDTDQKPFPTFDGMVDGHHIVVPYYDPDCPDVPKERKDFDLKAFAGMDAILNDLVTDLLVKRKPAYKFVTYPFTFYDYVTKRKAESAELIRRGFGKQMGDDFVKDALGILRDVHKYSDPDAFDKKEKSKEERREEAKQIAQDFSKFFNLFKGTVEQSPVGKYLDWSKMTIDGEPVAKEAAKFYNYFNNNGYKNAIYVMNGVVGLLSKLKG